MGFDAPETDTLEEMQMARDFFKIVWSIMKDAELVLEQYLKYSNLLQELFRFK